MLCILNAEDDAVKRAGKPKPHRKWPRHATWRSEPGLVDAGPALQAHARIWRELRRSPIEDVGVRSASCTKGIDAHFIYAIYVLQSALRWKMTCLLCKLLNIRGTYLPPVSQECCMT